MALTKYDQDGYHYWAPVRKISGGWTVFKSSPSAPTPPDPNVVSAAQTKSNIDTANANANLNRVNQVTPWGSQIYSQGDKNADGTSNWTQTTTLSPEQQKLLDASNGASLAMSDLGQKQIQNVASTINKPLDFNSLPGVQNAQVQQGGPIQGGINMSGIGPMTSHVQYGNIQGNLNTGNVPGLVGGDQLYNAMRDSQDAAYKQQASRLDPQWQQQQHDLQNQLTQQGVMQNSDAWNRAMDDLGRQKTDAYQTAYNNSVGNGNAAEAQLYGQGLSSNQNAYSQDLGTGQFHNAAQAQGFGQGMDNANLANNVVNNQFAQALAQQQASNSAQAQKFGQDSQASAQNFGQSMGARQQGINELMTQQQNPLNVLNALRTGSQITAPTFGGTPQANVGNTDTMSAANNAFNGQMGAYNGQIATNNANTSGAVQLGGAAMMAIAF